MKFYLISFLFFALIPGSFNAIARDDDSPCRKVLPLGVSSHHSHTHTYTRPKLLEAEQESFDGVSVTLSRAILFDQA